MQLAEAAFQRLITIVPAKQLGNEIMNEECACWGEGYE